MLNTRTATQHFWSVEMNIFCHHGEVRRAIKINGDVYQCHPPAGATVSGPKEFSSIEGAAIFLIRNPGWGIMVEAGVAEGLDQISIAYHSLAIDL